MNGLRRTFDLKTLSRPTLSAKLKNEKEKSQMSSHESEPWIDTWWPVLVITFGVIFVTILVSFNPTI